MTERKPASFIVRAVLANALILVGFYQAYHTGKLTPGIIALYLVIAAVVNGLMYLGARARQRLQDR